MNSIEVEAKLFNLYSALFCQPDEDLYDNLKILEDLELLQCSLYNGCCEDSHRLRNACLEYSYRELLVDYTQIFLGPYSIIAYPYSSVYFSGGVKTLNNETTQWVCDFYRSVGFEFNVEIKDMPDHIAVELEFLYLLKFNQLNYLNNSENDKAFETEERYRKFIHQHFGKWVPQLCNKVIENGENRYYINLCIWLKSLVLNHLLKADQISLTK